MVTIAVAGVLALAGCTAGKASGGQATAAGHPSAVATSYAQVKTLQQAIAYALTITPQTPDALNQIDQTGKLLKQYADASASLTSAQKSGVDGFVAKSQAAVQKGDVTDAGANLVTAAQGVDDALSGN